MYVRTAEGTTSDSLVYVFGSRGGDNGDSLTGEQFHGKKSVDNLSLLSCREKIVNEFTPNIIRSARFWIDSILSVSSSWTHIP